MRGIKSVAAVAAIVAVVRAQNITTIDSTSADVSATSSSASTMSLRNGTELLITNGPPAAATETSDDSTPIETATNGKSSDGTPVFYVIAPVDNSVSTYDTPYATPAAVDNSVSTYDTPYTTPAAADNSVSTYDTPYATPAAVDNSVSTYDTPYATPAAVDNSVSTYDTPYTTPAPVLADANVTPYADNSTRTNVTSLANGNSTADDGSNSTTLPLIEKRTILDLQIGNGSTSAGTSYSNSSAPYNNSSSPEGTYVFSNSSSVTEGSMQYVVNTETLSVTQLVSTGSQGLETHPVYTTVYTMQPNATQTKPLNPHITDLLLSNSTAFEIVQNGTLEFHSTVLQNATQHPNIVNIMAGGTQASQFNNATKTANSQNPLITDIGTGVSTLFETGLVTITYATNGSVQTRTLSGTNPAITNLGTAGASFQTQVANATTASRASPGNVTATQTRTQNPMITDLVFNSTIVDNSTATPIQGQKNTTMITQSNGQPITVTQTQLPGTLSQAVGTAPQTILTQETIVANTTSVRTESIPQATTMSGGAVIGQSTVTHAPYLNQTTITHAPYVNQTTSTHAPYINQTNQAIPVTTQALPQTQVSVIGTTTTQAPAVQTTQAAASKVRVGQIFDGQVMASTLVALQEMVDGQVIATEVAQPQAQIVARAAVVAEGVAQPSGVAMPSGVMPVNVAQPSAGGNGSAQGVAQPSGVTMPSGVAMPTVAQNSTSPIVPVSFQGVAQPSGVAMASGVAMPPGVAQPSASGNVSPQGVAQPSAGSSVSPQGVAMSSGVAQPSASGNVSPQGVAQPSAGSSVSPQGVAMSSGVAQPSVGGNVSPQGVTQPSGVNPETARPSGYSPVMQITDGQLQVLPAAGMSAQSSSSSSSPAPVAEMPTGQSYSSGNAESSPNAQGSSTMPKEPSSSSSSSPSENVGSTTNSPNSNKMGEGQQGSAMPSTTATRSAGNKLKSAGALAGSTFAAAVAMFVMSVV